MRFYVLGPLEARDGGGPEIKLGGNRRRTLLARLLLDANRVVPTGRLIEDLWGGDPPPGAAGTLQSHVSQLRRVIGADHLRTGGGGYQLVVGDGELDALVFEAEVAEARAHAEARRWAAAAAAFEAALARWNGSPYADIEDAGWLQAEVARLEELRYQGVEGLLEARLEGGEAARVVIDAERAVAVQPLRERLWTLLIVALYREGRQADALRAYQRVRSSLADELGIDPSPELQTLEHQVLAQDSALLGTSRDALGDAVADPPVLTALPSGVVTFLLTDVVGSTELWERQPAEMPAALGAHDHVMQEAVTSRGGTVLKARGEGDSTFSVFPRATDAVAAALDAQAALHDHPWPDGCVLRVRMAVHTGEALERDGDYYGRTVNRVARLRGTAGPGEVLLTRATADLVTDHVPEGCSLEEVGVRPLAGLDRPELVYRAHRGETSPPSTIADDQRLRRKVVTVVCVDLREHSGVLDEVDPAQRRTILGGYHGALSDIAAAHRGRLSGTTGDAVLVAFGVPDSGEDDAGRALAAAVEMAAAINARADDGGPAVTAGFGVHTGEVVVNADGVEVGGEPVTVASRLSLLAGDGEVLAGEATWRLTRATHDFDSGSVPPLRGPHGSVSVHRLVGDSTPRATPTTPFVGRDAEVAQLVAAFTAAVRRRQPRRATVIGSPGVGKSRLVAEVLSELDGQAVVASAGCDPAGGGALAPAAQLLDALGIGAVLEGEPVTPEETFAAVRRALANLAAERPVVLAVDDLHWAEPMLHDLLDHVVDWIDDRPVFVIAAARPELRVSRPALVEQGGRVGAVVALEGLDPDSTSELARELLGAAAPGSLLDRVSSASGGNPLFVRELLRMLVDDGVVEPGDEGWVVTEDVRLAEIPPTIQSLLAARIDRLDHDEKIVLERAAVIGTDVYLGALAELLPEAIRDRLDGLIDALRRKELLEPAGAYWLDERVLRFHHALIRDAAYRRLLREARAGLHEQVAGWLVAKTGGDADHDETIGYHLEQAQAHRRRLGPLDDHGQRVASDAARRLGAAAGRALDRDDLPAAAALAHRALDCLDTHDPACGDLLLVRCEALLGAGDVVAAGPSLAVLAEHAAGDPRLEAWATCFAVQRSALADPSAVAGAEDRVLDAAARFAELGDDAGAAKAHRVHASVLARLGRVGDCEVALDRALAAARAAGDRRQVTGVLSVAPLAALWGPSPVARAGGRCLDVIRLVRITTGSPAVEAASIRCQAVLEAYRGRVDAARSMLGAARRSTEELGLRQGLLEVELFAGMVELIGGDPAAAEPHLAEAQAGFSALGDGVDAAQAAAVRARALLALGRDDQALTATVDSERLGGQDLKTAIAWRAARAEVLARGGDLAEADALAATAVAMAERTDALVDHADACAAQAAVRRAAGDAAGAAAATERARALYEQKGASALVAALASGPEPAATEPRSAPATGAGTVAPLSNAASRHYEAAASLAAAGRIEEWTAVVPPGIVVDDRRAGLGSRLVGVDAVLANVRELPRVGIRRVETDVVAVRGDDHALLRTTWRGDPVAGFEVEVWVVTSCSDEGTVFVGQYDRADLTSAVDELDERFAAGLPDGAARCYRTMAAARRAVESVDEVALAALYAADLLVADHRLASFGEQRGVDRFIERLHTRDELAPGLVFLARRVRAVDDRTCFSETTPFWAGDAGPSLDQARLDVYRLRTPDGPIESVDQFPPGAVEAARARYRELSTGATDALGNTATRQLARFFDTLRDGDWAGMAALVSPANVFDDRRAGLALRVEGRDAVVDVNRTMREVFAEVGGRLVLDCLAVRGERLALVRLPMQSKLYENPLLMVVRVDAEGLGDLGVFFDDRDLAAAVDELDELYAAQLPEGPAACLRTLVALRRAHDAHDFDAVRARYAPDLVIADHRPASFGVQRGAEALIARHRVMAEMFPGYQTFVRRVHAVDDRTALFEDTPVLVEAAAARYDVGRLTVVRLRAPEGPVESFDEYPLDSLDAALARYRELTAGADRGLANPATRVFDATFEAVVAGRFEEIEASTSPDYERVDRRSGLATTHRGRDVFVDEMRTVRDLGVDRLASDVLAVRGEGLALIRARFGGASFAVEMLFVCGADDEGRNQLGVLFEPGDLVDALAELDARYAAGEGAAWPSTAVLAAANAAYSAKDWPRHRALFAEDVVVRDHRPASFPETRTAAAFHAGLVTEAEQLPDNVVYVTRYDRVDRLVALAELGGSAIGPGGGPVETARVAVVSTRGAGGPIATLDLFGGDQLAEARTTFALLAGAGGSPANAASRHAVAFLEAVEEHRWDDVRDLLADECVEDDRRRGLRNRIVGADAVVEQLRNTPRGGRFGVEVVAARGDRLALTRGIYRAGGDEVEFLGVTGLDNDGRRRFSVYFDVADLPAALDELDRRAREPTVNTARRVDEAGRRALLARDWAALERLWHPAFTMEDHRAGVQHRVESRDVAIEWYRITSAVGIGTISSRTVALAGERLALRRFELDAGGAEIEGYAVCEVDDAGLARRLDIYDVADFPAALADYDQRAAALADRPAPENAASRHYRRAVAALERGDAEGLAQLLTPGAVLDDRRRGLQNRAVGRDAVVSEASTIVGFGAFTVGTEVVAVRGERLALLRARFRGGELDIDVLVVDEVDEERQGVATVNFDPDDLDAAYTELDRREAALGARAASNAAVRMYRRVVAALESGDIDGLAPFLTPGATTVERRRGLQNTVAGRDAVLADLRTVAGFGPATIEYEVLAVRGDRLALLRSAHCGAFLRVELLVVFEVDEEGNGVVAVNLDPADLDAAFADLDERDRRLQGTALWPDNLALRMERERGAAVVAGDWDRVRELVVPGVALDDHRRGMRHRAEGADAVIEWFQAVHAAGVDSIAYVPIDTHGERLALFEVVVRGGDFEIASAVLVEVDERGRALRLDNFDGEDRELARAELDRRRRRGGELENAATRHFRRVPRALANGDFEAFRPFLAADAAIDDRRAGLGHLSAGPDAVLVELEAIRDLGGRQVDLHVVAVRGERLALLQMNVAGAGLNVESVVVIEVDEQGRGGASVVFDPADLADALLELDDRFAAGEASPHARVVRAGAAFMHARNRGDWQAVRALHAPGAVGTDRRKGLLAESRGADELVSRNQAMADLVPGYHSCLRRYHALEFDRAVGEFAPVVLGPGAGGYDSPRWLVGHVDAAGRFDLFEAYDLDDLDAALARYRGIGPGGDDANAAARCWTRVGEAFLARDFEALAQLYAGDCVADDRRTGLGYVTEGRDALFRQLRSMVDLGVDRQLAELLAIRGDRLALHRMVMGGSKDSSFEVESLFVSEIGADGRIVAAVTFDAGDLEGALTELEHRFLTGEGVGQAPWLSLTMPGIVLAHARRDWDVVRRMYDEGVVLVDHRPAGIAEVRGADAVVDYHRTMVGVASAHREMIRHQLAIGDRVTLSVLVTGGEGEAGYEIVSLLVTVHRRDGRVRRLELFPLDAEDDARARFAALDAGLRAVDVHDVVVGALNGRDWDTLRAQLADGFAFADHRPAGWGLLDADATVGHFRQLAELSPDSHTVDELVDAAPGAALMSATTTGTGVGGGKVEIRSVVVVAVTDGVATRMDVYAPEALDDASARFAAVVATARIG